MTALLMVAGVHMAGAAGQAVAGSHRRRTGSLDTDRVVNGLADLGWPLLCNLGFSGVVGFCTGVALKVFGQALALVLGVGFITLQIGAHFGVVQVNWAVLHRQVASAFDLDHNGRLEKNDFKRFIAYVLGILGQGVPGIVGFNAGFLLAFR